MSLLLIMLKSTDVLVKISLRIPEHSEIPFAFPERSCSRTQQAWLSTRPLTHLSLYDIGGKLLILSESITSIPKAPSTVLRAFHMIKGKQEKTWGSHDGAQ